jgi:hypothetical protein
MGRRDKPGDDGLLAWDCLMPCVAMKLPNGTVALVNVARGSTKKCRFCGAPATRLCDYITVVDLSSPGRPETCDAPLCARCTIAEGRFDNCPQHPDLSRRQHELAL